MHPIVPWSPILSGHVSHYTHNNSPVYPCLCPILFQEFPILFMIFYMFFSRIPYHPLSKGAGKSQKNSRQKVWPAHSRAWAWWVSAAEAVASPPAVTPSFKIPSRIEFHSKSSEIPFKYHLKYLRSSKGSMILEKDDGFDQKGWWYFYGSVFGVEWGLYGLTQIQDLTRNWIKPDHIYIICIL